MSKHDTLTRRPVDADVICALVSQLGSHSQLKVLRHLYHEFSMFNCADGIDVAADEIELELLREDVALHGERVS
jgi:hypothetical protein